MTAVSVIVRSETGSLDPVALVLGAANGSGFAPEMVTAQAHETADGSVQLARRADGSPFVFINLASLPGDIERIIIGGKVGTAEGPRIVFVSIESATGDLLVSGRTVAQPDVRAIGIIELYRRKTGWRCRVLSTGYANGLTALVADYGAAVAAEPAPPMPAAVGRHRRSSEDMFPVDAARDVADNASPEVVPAGVAPAMDTPDAAPVHIPVEAASLDNAPQAEPDHLVCDRYRLQRLLGHGAMGDVWLAADTVLGRAVALKHFRSHLASEDKARARMMREARLAAHIHHPHAIVVYDLVIDSGTPYLVMQYIAGRSLAKRIAEEGRLSIEDSARMTAEVAGALGQAHAQGIVHRDIKPANILLNQVNSATLGDFGIARSSGDASLTQSGYLIGTPAFLAPELARGATADARSDVYALGGTLWNALEGVPPFAGKDVPNSLAMLAKILTEDVPPPTHAGWLAPLVAAMMDPEPDIRPTAAQVEGYLVSRISPRPPASPAPQAPEPRPALAVRADSISSLTDVLSLIPVSE